MISRLLRFLAVSLFFVSFPAFAQAPATAGQPGYVALARLADGAPVVAKVTVRRAIPLEPERAVGVAPGMVRLYVEADVQALIRGRNGLPESIRYLVDMPLEARGKVPKIKKRQYLIFARTAAGAPGEVQLVAKNAQVPWSEPVEMQTRTILRDMVAADAPPRISGVREALHVRGNLQGEGETQFFLATDSGAPVSITVLRRPGLAPRWAVSLTEIVDEAAAPPRKGSLLWYRLACALPDTVPTGAMVSNTPEDNNLALRDYAFVLEQLGPCTD